MRGRAPEIAGFVVLSVVLVGAMWAVPYLPTNDGPEWVFATHVENHYADAGTGYASAFVPALEFASRGFALVYGPFEAWLGWERGLEVALSIVVLLTAWSFAFLARSLHPGRWWLGFLGFPLALSWELYMGLWAFVVSTAASLFVLAVAARRADPTPGSRAILAFLLLLNAVSHVFGAVLAGGCLLSLGLWRARPGRRLVELAWLAATGLPAMGVLAACVLVSGDLPQNSLSRGFERLPWRDALAILPRTIAPGPLWRAAIVTLLVLAAAVLAAVRVGRRDTSPVDRGLGAAGLVLALLAVLTPFQIPGWQGFSERFVPLGVALLILVLPVEGLRPEVRRLGPLATFAAALLSLGATYPFHERLARLCPDAIKGLTSPVHVGGALFPVTIRNTELAVYDRIDAEVPMMLPLAHMGTLYAAAHGGISPLSFASGPAVYPFVRRNLPLRPLPDAEHYLRTLASPRFHHDLAFRREVDGELASFGMFYDEAAVFGALPEDLAVWAERGFVADWSGESTLLAHFEPCTIDFVVPAAAREPPPAFDLRVGEIGLASGVSAPSTLGEDGHAHFALSPAPCGVVRVHAAWPGGAVRCANADPQGDVIARVSRHEGTVVCEIH